VATLKAAPSPPVAGPGTERADGGEIRTLRKSYADMGNDVDRMKSDLLAVNTRLDENRVEMQRITSRQNEFDQKFQELRAPERLKELEKRVAAHEERLGKAGAVPAGAAAAGEAAPEWKNPEEMYDYGVGQVKGSNPRKGRDILTAFVSKYPAHKLVPNALYWKGEAFYAEKDYENAILSFQDVVDKYPSGDKAPDAMYKQGISFLSLNDKKNARVLLELVGSRYPKSKAAEMARKKLAEIQ
jgi:tol-pal system protein YbgF